MAEQTPTTQDPSPTYVEKNKGRIRPYSINNPRVKHARMERFPDGGIGHVLYGIPNQQNPDLKPVIELTPEDAKKESYRHLRLMPVQGGKPLEIKPSE